MTKQTLTPGQVWEVSGVELVMIHNVNDLRVSTPLHQGQCVVIEDPNHDSGLVLIQVVGWINSDLMNSENFDGIRMVPEL